MPEIMNMLTNAFVQVRTCSAIAPLVLRFNASSSRSSFPSLSQQVFGAANANLDMVGMKEMPKPKNTLNLDFSSLLGPLLYVGVVQLPMPVVLINIVYEKEFKLRTMMKMMGLSDIAYWLITFSYNLFV